MVVFNAKADGYEPGTDYLFLGIGECYDQGAEVARWVSQNYKNEGTMRILHLTGSMSQSWSLDRGRDLWRQLRLRDRIMNLYLHSVLIAAELTPSK